MQYRRKCSFLRKASAFLLFVFTLTCFVFSAASYGASGDSGDAADSDKVGVTKNGITVRVGCYDLGNFISRDAAGKYTGYGADYLSLVSEYTGWNFEITVTDNESLSRKLKNGEIDLLMPVSYGKERLNQYVYTNYPIGEQTNGLYILKGDKDIGYEDYQSFSGMKIGVVANTYPQTSLKKFAAAHGFPYTEMCYPDLESMSEALEKGETDAVCRSGLGDIPGNYLLVAATDPIPFYVVADAEKPSRYFTEFNNAVNRIYSDRPDFAADLYDRYLSGQNASEEVNLTKEEKEYIREHPLVTVAGFSDRYPLCYADPKTGNLSGIFREIMEQVSGKTGLRFQYKTLPAGTAVVDGLKDPGVDISIGVIRTEVYRNDPNINLSLGFFKNLTGIAGPAGQAFEPDRKYTVALPTSAIGTIEHVRDYHPDYTIVTADTIEDCMRMVLSGKADAAMQNSDILAGTLQHPEFSRLVLWHTFTSEGEYNYCAADRVSENPLLLSIVNKGIRSLNQDEVEAIKVKYNFSTKFPMTFRDFIAKFGLLILVAGFLSAIIITILLYAFRMKQKNVLKLEAAAAESERANNAKSEFLSNMSHDIRTPMNAIVGMTNMAQQSIESGDYGKAADDLKIVRTSSKQLLSLVNDVLDLSKIESGKMVLANDAFSLPVVIGDIMSVIQPLCIAKSQNCRVHMENLKHEFVYGDPVRMKQVLINILNNANKYTQDGGKINFDISENPLENPGMSEFVFRVQDNGIGVAKEKLETIFEAFNREVNSNVNQVEGTGLGLAIVKRIVEARGGKVTAESEKGKGSVFTVRVPLKLQDEKEALETYTFLRGRKILVVEETENYGSDVCRMLNDAGAESRCTTDISLAAEEAAKDPGIYLVALIDREKEPVEAVKKIREAASKQAIILILCNESMKELEDSARKAGADGILKKPLFRSILYGKIMEVCSGDSKGGTPDQYLFGKRILIVDDVEINRMIAQITLEKAGATVERAGNGKEALDKFEASEPGYYDAILMDVMMPVMGGYEATRKLRALLRPDAAKIPVIAMTANAFVEDIRKSEEAGMNAHITKPMEEQKIRETLMRFFT